MSFKKRGGRALLAGAIAAGVFALGGCAYNQRSLLEENYPRTAVPPPMLGPCLGPYYPCGPYPYPGIYPYPYYYPYPYIF